MNQARIGKLANMLMTGFLAGVCGTATADPTLSQADRSFVAKAAQGGEMEVKAGSLAASRAADPEVKAFGQKMVVDHATANDMLKSLAASKQLPLPGSLGPEEDAALGKLEALNGADFDRAYAQLMVKDHVAAIKEFQKEAKSGRDPDVKAFAEQTLPTLRHHLMMAEHLTKQHQRSP